MIEETGKQRESFGTESNVYSWFNIYYGWSTGWCGDFDKGKQFLERGLHSAVEIDHKTNLGMAELMFGYLHCAKGEGEIAVKYFQRAIRYLEEVKFVHLLGAVRAGLGWGYHLLGEQEKARMHIEEGIRIQDAAGLSYHLSRLYFVLTMVYFASGDFNDARISAEKAIELAQNCDEKHYEAFSKIWLGRALGKAKSSESNEVTKHIYEGIEILDELNLEPFRAQGYLFLGECYADRREPEKALENLRMAEGMFQEMGMDYWLGKTRNVLERL